ncbi:MAG TPA: TRAP transporter substrate-binding protein [Pseudolabrys sp.]|jgi:tripartite ATP-independent transporter DctP family solute receptor|nr:TRAP transporter substrate-binding protein [Pseudolabrys sp.]
MISRRTVLKTAAAAASQAVALPYFARNSFAAQTLKCTFADTRNHPLYQVLLRFADNVKKKTNGALEVQVFSTGELGSQTNILTGLQTGIIDLCAHTSGYIDTLIPQFQVMDLPFLFKDLATAEKILDGPTGKQLADLLPPKGIYGLSYGYWGWRVTSTIDRKVPEPQDMKGLKIRVQPGPIFAAMFRTLGANPIAIDYSEIYLALSQHTIEAIETPIIALPSAKHYEVVKVINLTNHVYNAGVMMVSKRKFDAMAKNIQENLREAAHELTGDWRKTMVQKTDETSAFLKGKGLSINPVDRAAYRKALDSVYKDFRKVIGGDLMDSVLKQAEA